MGVRTWKQIKWQGINCKRNVENNYRIGMYPQWGYYMAKAIIKPYTNIKRITTMKVAPKPTGDKVKMRIPKKDYMQLAKDLIYFVEKKGRMRNYLDYKGKRIRCRLYIYLFAQALDYFNQHKKFPDYIDIDYKKFYPPTPKPELHGYLTDEGCSELGQCNGYFCACNSLQQCFYRLTGIHVSEWEIADWAGTTEDGTDHSGIETAVAQFNRLYNKNVKIKWYNFSELGWDKCKELMSKGAVFHHICYRRQWGHYEVPKEVYGSTLDALNSLGDRCSYPAYCGYIENREKSEHEVYLSEISQKSVAYLYHG